MKQITKYEAFDGIIFDTPDEALAHERKLTGSAVIRKWLALKDIEVEQWEAEVILDFVNAMTEGPNAIFICLMREVYESDDESGG